MSEGAWNGIVGWAKKRPSHNACLSQFGSPQQEHDKGIVWASERIAELEKEAAALNKLLDDNDVVFANTDGVIYSALGRVKALLNRN